MKRFLQILACIFIIALVVYVFQPRVDVDSKLSKHFQQLVDQKVETIDLRKETDFDWTESYLFAPYTSQEELEDTLQANYIGNDGGIETRDDRFLLVFKNGEKIVKAVILSRDHSDYRLEQSSTLVVVYK